MAWRELMANATICNFWKTILECHIVVVRVPCGADSSVIKLAETKDLSLTKKSRINLMSPVAHIKCEYHTTQRVKLLVPRDVRMLRCRGFEGRPAEKSNSEDGKPLIRGCSITMDIFGDGQWARRYSDVDGGSTTWHIFVSPRQSELLVPGLLVSIFDLLFCFYCWRQKLTFGSDLKAKVLLPVVLSLLPVFIPVLTARHTASYLCRRITAKYAFLATVSTVLWLIFPLLPTSYSKNEKPDIIPAYLEWIWPYTVSSLNSIRTIVIFVISLCFVFFVISCISGTSCFACLTFVIKKSIMRLWNALLIIKLRRLLARVFIKFESFLDEPIAFDNPSSSEDNR